MLIFKYLIKVAKYPSRKFALITFYQEVKEVVCFVCLFVFERCREDEEEMKLGLPGLSAWAVQGDVGGMWGSSGPGAGCLGVAMGSGLQAPRPTS